VTCPAEAAARCAKPGDIDASAELPSSAALEMTSPAAGRPQAAFTVDVEDWYQSCVDVEAPITDRVVANVDRILELLDECTVKGTFFVQGRVAETFPRLVEGLVRQGHEVACHGYSHRPLFGMNARQLRHELERAKHTVEDAGGVEVTAFRAQDFSILARNLWALEALADVGFAIDSSIFPMRTPRYGISKWELAPQRIQFPNGASILEVPVAVWEVRRWRIPVGGGGYFRLLPPALVRRAFREIVAANRPPIIYCHPYEFNPSELDDYRGSIPTSLRVSQGLGRDSFAQRIRLLLGSMCFGRFDDVLVSWGLT
jgi:polysaccharide deacetylase family protein (PEP-CTERM system associated)